MLLLLCNEDVGMEAQQSAAHRGTTGGLTSARDQCRVEGCTVNLRKAKPYGRKHQICFQHMKQPSVEVGGQACRWCQQCARFQPLSNFDGSQRSCSESLAQRNARAKRSASAMEQEKPEADETAPVTRLRSSPRSRPNRSSSLSSISSCIGDQQGVAAGNNNTLPRAFSRQPGTPGIVAAIPQPGSASPAGSFQAVQAAGAGNAQRALTEHAFVATCLPAATPQGGVELVMQTQPFDTVNHTHLAPVHPQLSLFHLPPYHLHHEHIPSRPLSHDHPPPLQPPPAHSPSHPTSGEPTPDPARPKPGDADMPKQPQQGMDFCYTDTGDSWALGAAAPITSIMLVPRYRSTQSTKTPADLATAANQTATTAYLQQAATNHPTTASKPPTLAPPTTHDAPKRLGNIVAASTSAAALLPSQCTQPGWRQTAAAPLDGNADGQHSHSMHSTSTVDATPCKGLSNLHGLPAWKQRAITQARGLCATPRSSLKPVGPCTPFSSPAQLSSPSNRQLVDWLKQQTSPGTFTPSSSPEGPCSQQGHITLHVWDVQDDAGLYPPACVGCTAAWSCSKGLIPGAGTAMAMAMTSLPAGPAMQLEHELCQMLVDAGLSITDAAPVVLPVQLATQLENELQQMLAELGSSQSNSSASGGAESIHFAGSDHIWVAPIKTETPYSTSYTLPHTALPSQKCFAGEQKEAMLLPASTAMMVPRERGHPFTVAGSPTRQEQQQRNSRLQQHLKRMKKLQQQLQQQQDLLLQEQQQAEHMLQLCGTEAHSIGRCC